MTIGRYHWGFYSMAFVLLGLLVWWLAGVTRGYSTFDGFNLFAVVLITVGMVPEKEERK